MIPTPITISGVIRDPDNIPASGKFVFANVTPVRSNLTDEVMTPDEIVAYVASDGILTVVLPATDDPDWSPTGWTWEVRPHFPFWRTPFAIAVPYNSPGLAIDFSTLVPVPPDGDGALYALVNHAHADQGGGGGSTLVVKRRLAVSGNTTPPVNAAWAVVAGAPTLSIPAVVGDMVEFKIEQMLFNPANGYFDLAVLVDGSPVRYMATNTVIPGSEGNPTFYPQPSSFRTFGPTFGFVVASGDLSGGEVTVAWANRGNGTGTIYADATYPLRWSAKNYGAVPSL